MVNMRWEINGRAVDPHNAADALTSAIMKEASEAIRTKVGECVCPEHGERPTIVGADPLTKPSFTVTGCCEKLVDEVKQKLA